LNNSFENNEIEILRQLRKGDEKAFEILFYQYKKRVKGFVHKMLPPNISSEEIVQEIFIKVWLNRLKIDPSKNFASFIFVISKNQVLDELKAAINKKLIFTGNQIIEEVSAVQSNESTEEEMETNLAEILQKLPQRRRQIFSLSRFEGLTYKQIAAKLNITENTVDTQIRKSLQFLRQELNNFL